MAFINKTRCLQCNKGPVGTLDSRHDGQWRYRRKRCEACGYRWSTYEVPAELLYNLVDSQAHLLTVKTALQQLEKTLTTIPIVQHMQGSVVNDD